MSLEFKVWPQTESHLPEPDVSPCPKFQTDSSHSWILSRKNVMRWAGGQILPCHNAPTSWVYKKTLTLSSLPSISVSTRVIVLNSQYFATSDEMSSSTIDPVQYNICKTENLFQMCLWMVHPIHLFVSFALKEMWLTQSLRKMCENDTWTADQKIYWIQTPKVQLVP